jgi:hypothetical protein
MRRNLTVWLIAPLTSVQRVHGPRRWRTAERPPSRRRRERQDRDAIRPREDHPPVPPDTDGLRQEVVADNAEDANQINLIR